MAKKPTKLVNFTDARVAMEAQGQQLANLLGQIGMLKVVASDKEASLEKMRTVIEMVHEQGEVTRRTFWPDD